MAAVDDDVALGPAVSTEPPDVSADDDVAVPLRTGVAGSSSRVGRRLAGDEPCSGHFGAWLFHKLAAGDAVSASPSLVGLVSASGSSNIRTKRSLTIMLL